MVSDSSQGQDDVEANVTVQVKSLQPSEITHTTPLTLAADSDTVVKPDVEVGIRTFVKWYHCFVLPVAVSFFTCSLLHLKFEVAFILIILPRLEQCWDPFINKCHVSVLPGRCVSPKSPCRGGADVGGRGRRGASAIGAAGAGEDSHDEGLAVRHGHRQP